MKQPKTKLKVKEIQIVNAQYTAGNILNYEVLMPIINKMSANEKVRWLQNQVFILNQEETDLQKKQENYEKQLEQLIFAIEWNARNSTQ